jgi:hypothetical protein
MVTHGHPGVCGVNRLNANLGGAAIALAVLAAGAAEASSIVVVDRPAAASSVMVGSGPAGKSPSLIVVAPPTASVDVLSAPNAAMRTLGPSVVALGTPTVAGTEAAAADAPKPMPFAHLEIPTVIRGGIVGNAFPSAVPASAPVEEEEVPHGQPQVGNDGNPVSDVSPGSSQSSSHSSSGGGRSAPRLAARPSAPSGSVRSPE